MVRVLLGSKAAAVVFVAVQNESSSDVGEEGGAATAVFAVAAQNESWSDVGDDGGGVGADFNVLSLSWSSESSSTIDWAEGGGVGDACFGWEAEERLCGVGARMATSLGTL